MMPCSARPTSDGDMHEEPRHPELQDWRDAERDRLKKAAHIIPFRGCFGGCCRRTRRKEEAAAE